MGKSSGTPPAPNPTSTANGQMNYEQNNAAFNASLNRYNVNSPFGSMSWSQTGTDPKTGAPIYGQNISLAPDAQQALTNTQKTQAGLSGLQGQAMGGVSNALNSNPFDQSKLPASMVNAGQTGQDALMERFQPMMDLQNKQFEADQANRGIAQGSDPYNANRQSLDFSQNDLRSQAALNGINVGNQAQNQAMNVQSWAANSPLNYLNGLMSSSQIQTPQFQGTPSVMANAPNYQSAVGQGYQGQLNGYNAQTGANNSMMSGLFGLGASTAPYWSQWASSLA
jgi:hypothetical protein